MSDIDVIILSNTANLELYTVLKRCITSIKKSVRITPRIILIETNKKLKDKFSDLKLPVDIFFVPEDETFNYNKFQNYGLGFVKSNYICFSNNDVIYEENTLHTLKTYLNKYDSVSPWEKHYSPMFFSKRGIYEGYATRQYITGWCFCTTTKTIEAIGGKFDEQFSFWYADDDYANLLQQNNLKHALIGDTTVEHLVEQSKTLHGDKLEENTTGQEPIFLNKWKNN